MISKLLIVRFSVDQNSFFVIIYRQEFTNDSFYGKEISEEKIMYPFINGGYCVKDIAYFLKMFPNADPYPMQDQTREEYTHETIPDRLSRKRLIPGSSV